MKNPWMSAWLSAANSMTGAARGQFIAEMHKTQTRMIRDWQDAWLAMWFPPKGKSQTARSGRRKR